VPIFKIACSWEVCGEAEIEANTFEEAWLKAKRTEEDIPLPTDTTYIDGSFTLDKETSELLNERDL